MANIWAFIVAHWWQLIVAYVCGGIVTAWYCHYQDYIGDDDDNIGWVFFGVLLWPISIILYTLSKIGPLVWSVIDFMFSLLFRAADEIMWLITRKLVDKNDNGKLYKGWHARWCTKEYRYGRIYAVLHVQDSTGKYKIPVPPESESVNEALAWSYNVKEYDAVRA